MIQKPIAISVIAVVGVAGILTLSVLAAISSTNQAFAAKKPTFLSVYLPSPIRGKPVGEEVPVRIEGSLCGNHSCNDGGEPVPNAAITVNCEGASKTTKTTSQRVLLLVGLRLLILTTPVSLILTPP